MRNTQKGFTLVELIVVITILAILGTIAFISLQGYSQDARNAKVGSDLATVSKMIEVSNTNGSLDMTDLTTGGNTANVVDNTLTISTFDDQNNPTAAALSTLSYDVGAVDFAALRQNGADFIDPEDNAYLVAVAGNANTYYYQLVGQTKGADGEYRGVVRGNYVAQAGDVTGLVSPAPAGTTTAVVNDVLLGAGVSLY